MPTMFNKKVEPEDQNKSFMDLFGILNNLGSFTQIPTPDELIRKSGEDIRYLEDSVNVLFDVYDPDLCKRIRNDHIEWCNEYKNCIKCRIEFVRLAKERPYKEAKENTPEPTRVIPVIDTTSKEVKDAE